MRLPRAIALLGIGLLVAANAAAGESEYPWIVVYQQDRCARVEALEPALRVENLLGALKCKKEDFFAGDDVLSVGCEESLGTGFIFARSKASCEVALAALREAVRAMEKPSDARGD